VAPPLFVTLPDKLIVLEDMVPENEVDVTVGITASFVVLFPGDEYPSPSELFA
jgi:hypothetical protein